YPAERSPFQLVLGLGIPLLMTALFVTGAKTGVPVWWIPLIGIAVAVAVFMGSPKTWIPPWEWALAIISAITALYIYFFYDSIGSRVGAPFTQDFIVATAGLMLLLEATRRSLG